MSKANILVIEDNEEVRENLAEILELYGYHVRQAANGIEGVKQAVEHLPDIILCDVMMPELDGYGVLNLLNENERTAGTPFVFITARTETEDIRRGMMLGADDYITKPFYKDELLEVIQVRLRRAEQRKGGAEKPQQNVAHLSDPERGADRLKEAFTENGRSQVFNRHQIINREGDRAHFIYLIEAGHVHLSRAHEYGRDYVIAELGPGEIFGVPTILEGTPLHYSAKAITDDTKLVLLPAANLLKLINSDRQITEALMHLMAGKVVEHGERLANQAYDSVRRRTALVLCDLHQKYAGEPIELSREELAQMVGSTKESVIRSLSDFKKDGLLRTEGRVIIISKAEALRSLLV